MKHLKYTTMTVTLVALLLIGFAIKQPTEPVQPKDEAKSKAAEHIYASWETMEFDKCVSAWLIVRFIDKDAKFVFYPQGTEITQGIVFDVPGANWSRKHRKCTSQCILETMDNPDLALEQIVSIAGKIELNFWQLDRWPKAQKCFYEVKEITDATDDPLKCFENTRPYFDQLYKEFKNSNFIDNDSSLKKGEE